MTACCRHLLRESSRLGMRECPKCRRQWYLFAPGFAKRWGSDRVYHNGEYLGTVTYHGELRAMIERSLKNG